MQIRNRTLGRADQIMRSGSRIEVRRDPSDPMLFDTSLNFRMAEASELDVRISSGAELLDDRVGFDFKGTGAVSAGISMMGKCFWTDNDHPIDIGISFSVWIPPVVSGSGIEMELEVSGAGAGSSFFTIKQDFFEIMAIDGSTMAFPRTESGWLDIEVRYVRHLDRNLKQAFWVDGKPVQVMAHRYPDSGAYEGDGVHLTFSGTSTPSSNGIFKFWGLTVYPVLSSETWVDASPTEMPLCISYTEDHAIFDCAPISPGVHKTLKIYGTNVLSEQSSDLPEVEAIFDPYQKDHYSLMVSPVEKLYTDSERIALCPIEAAEVDSRSDIGYSNRCFEDGHFYDGDKPVYMHIVSSGDLKDGNTKPSVAFDFDGRRYGKDFDVSLIHPFDAHVINSDVPFADIVPSFESTLVDGEYRVVRTKVLSNNKRLYYGLIVPHLATETELPKIRFTLQNVNLRVARPGLNPVSGTKFSVYVYKLGTNDQPVYRSLNIDAGSSLSFELALPRGQYRLVLSREQPTTGDLAAFSGHIKIEMKRPGLTNYIKLSEYDLHLARSPYCTALEVFFDVKEPYGKLWWMLYDPAKSALDAFSVVDDSTVYGSNAYTDSVGAVEIKDGVILVYQPAANNIHPSDVGLDLALSYLRLDSEGVASGTGRIFLGGDDDEASLRRIYSFDATDINGRMYVYFNYEWSRPTVNKKTVTMGTDRYVGIHLQEDCLPFLDKGYRISSFDLGDIEFLSDEYLQGQSSFVELSSLNNSYAAYSTRGLESGKYGAEGAGFRMRPHYYTMPAVIRANPCREIGSTVISVVDLRFRHPLIMVSTGHAARELAVPPFFNISYWEKELCTPVESLDACWNGDGNIWAVASTISLIDHDPFYPSPPKPVDFNDPTFEFMIIPTDILNSNETVFLKRSLTSSWFRWSGVEGYESKYRMQAVPVLNQYSEPVRQDVGPVVGGVIVPDSAWENAKIIDHKHRETVSCCTDKNLFVIGQSGMNERIPRLYQMGRADTLPFSVPLHESHCSSDVVLSDNPVNGRLVLGDETMTYAIRPSCVVVEGVTDIWMMLMHSYDNVGTRRDSYNLDRGTRAKVTLTTLGLVDNGITLTMQDCSIDESVAVYPPTTEYGVFLVDVVRDHSGPLRIETYINTPGGRDNIAETVYFDDSAISSGAIDIHLLIKRSGVDKYICAVIVKANSVVSDASKFWDWMSPLASGRPFYTEDQYSSYYSRNIVRAVSRELPILVDSFPPMRYLAISLSNGISPADYFHLYNVQMGSMSVENQMEERWNNFPHKYHPNFTETVTQGHDLIVSREQGVLSADVYKSSTGFPIGTINNQQLPIYWKIGYAITPHGTSAKVGDRHVLVRERYETVDSARANYLHGKWLSTSDWQEVTIWADSHDSGLEKFQVNKVCLTGINFSKFYIVGRDDIEDDWTKVAYIDTFNQSYRSLNSVEAVSGLVASTSEDDLIIPARVSKYGYVDNDSGVVFKVERLQKGRLVFRGLSDSIDIDAPVKLFNDKYQATIPDCSYRYFGIQIVYQPTYEGLYTISTVDFGSTSSFSEKFSPNGDSGMAFEAEAEVDVMLENGPIDHAYKRPTREYSVTYEVASAREYVRVRAITEAVSLYNKPIWVLSNDPDEFDLTLMSGSPENQVLIYDDERLYEVSIKLRSIK